VTQRRFVYTGAGLASFLLFLLANIPASALTGLLDSRLPENIRISGVDGTFWNGSVHSVNINRLQFSAAQWDLNPLGLLMGQLSIRVKARVAGGDVNIDSTISLSGTITLRDLEATGLIMPIAAEFNLPVTGGQYQVQISELSIADGWPTSFVGSVRVDDVPLNIMGDPNGPKGSYAVEFDAETVPEDGRLIGTLSDDGGLLEVGGNIVLTPPNNYELQAKLKARRGAPADITSALKLVGPAGSDGRREISLAGTL
jgi:general secretion pathway protein N